MKPAWTRKLTIEYLNDTDKLMIHLKEYRKKWKDIVNKYQKPKREDSNLITDKDADICDLFENALLGYNEE